MTQGHEQITPEPARHEGPSPGANAASPPPPAAAPAATATTPGGAKGAEPSRAAPARNPGDYILTVILALVFGALGSYVFTHFLDEPPRTTEADQKSAAESENAGPSTGDLRDRIDKLSDRMDVVSRRIDDLPKPEPPHDLSNLQIHVADLTKSAEEIAPLRDAVKRNDARLDEMGQSVRSLGDELHALKSRLGIVRTTTTGTGSGSGRPEHKEQGDRKPDARININAAPEKPVAAETLKQGAALFHQQKYKEALDFFSKLEQSNPGDARVWYYAALSHGFATNQWLDDGTGSLVEKGIECERAGTPPRAVIDEAFKDLTSATGKDWLATYRKRVNIH